MIGETAFFTFLGVMVGFMTIIVTIFLWQLTDIKRDMVGNFRELNGKLDRHYRELSDKMDRNLELLHRHTHTSEGQAIVFRSQTEESED
jgi:pantothenate kinase-related protein Tda10